ncbi:MAG TPA: ABC transporter ATP-binding protein/permease [Xanthobacteraceae bacterium]|nr:ABC transporter ATP-binding protein/permease [Xanthobacteraceae bacterium]
MSALLSTLAAIRQLAVPYFRSDDRLMGRTLLGAVIAMMLGDVVIDVLLNQWNARFYNALQDRNWNAFTRELMIFSALAGTSIVLQVYQLYFTQWLQIRWRRFMTERYLGGWLDAANHYRMQLLGDAADNPDQRIADDVRMFVESGLPLAIRLLRSAVAFLSFVAILWVLSDEVPLTIFGVVWPIPGYLVWAALIYAAIATVVTHLIGRALVGLNFNRQRLEADFRFNLVRVRENAEQIALLRGEAAERERLLDRFGAIIGNWLLIMSRTKRVAFFTVGAAQAAVIFPYVVVAPAYFAGHGQLGILTQTANAFENVRSALSFFMEFYRDLAEWRAVIARLSGFEAAIAAGRAAATTAPVVAVVAGEEASPLRAHALDVRLPNGAPLVHAEDFAVSCDDRVLVTGPTGSGKSTLFRAVDGIWPFGSGTVTIPRHAEVMVLPQRPYFPTGSLADAIAYPSQPGRFDAAALRDVLTAVGLPAFAERLDERAHWNRMLSLGEQQRLAVARAILHAPDYLFLDEATASLDEPSEAALYRLMQARLPHTAMVSIGHRSTLFAFHRRHLALERAGDRYQLQESGIRRVMPDP